MICKDSFVQIMDGLRDYWEELRKDMHRLGVVFEHNHFTKVFNTVLDAISDDVEAVIETDNNEPWCYYFAFELDWGRREMAKNCVTFDGVSYSLENAGQLYDLLIMLKESKYNEFCKSE